VPEPSALLWLSAIRDLAVEFGNDPAIVDTLKQHDARLDVY
jgi:hypothetical protein